jgi:hypothetical protein
LGASGSARLDATLHGRSHAHLADLHRVNKPENDDASIVEPIEMAADAT